MNEERGTVILFLQRDFESEYMPAKNKVIIAQKLVDEGVDIIIGHTHVLQDFEYYFGKKDIRIDFLSVVKPGYRNEGLLPLFGSEITNMFLPP
ncbi:MAG: hypothetical protein FXF54_01490 [Kosmotoga sp.]|nr:MAG: hypothetical protein FXF54_01490 [Kosmotoga sp.]